MRDRADSPYAEDWLKVARRDWHRLHVLLNDGDADGAGFFLQQAMEKYLKAFLLIWSRPIYGGSRGADLRTDRFVLWKQIRDVNWGCGGGEWRNAVGRNEFLR